MVSAGGETILFDTGLNAAAITTPLNEAGIVAEDVSIAVLTHLRGDHVDGLTGEDGTPNFANARYVTGQTEYDAWAKMGSEGFLDSDGEQLLLVADTANRYVWSLAYPDWEVTFDMDKAQAAATRIRVSGMLAAERIPLVGYRMPFPGTGFVETRVEGAFRYVPTSVANALSP